MGGILIDDYGYESMAFCFLGVSCLVISANVKELWNLVVYPKRGGQSVEFKIFQKYLKISFSISDLLYPPLLENRHDGD